MKKIIHPQYAHLEKSFDKILNGDYTPDVVFCNKRNVVEKVTVEGKAFVVKRYKQPVFINRIAYRVFRKSKARRAYEYALELLKYGVETPFPAAYFEFYKNGLFDYGVFISEYVPYNLLENVYDEAVPKEERDIILNSYVDFLLSVHKKGIMPMDMNGGNIFYYKDEATGQYKFALTDINRMKFNVVPGVKEVAFSFDQCFSEMHQQIDLARIYSRKKKCDITYVVYLILSYRMKRRKKNLLKNKFRKKN